MTTPRVNPQPSHGSMRRYWRGCRCRKCRIENALYTSNRREALRADASVTVPHGTDRGYTAFACRCDVCTRAHAVAVRKNREVRRKTDPTTWKHGRDSTYTNYGCRCELCRAKHTAVLRKWRRRTK